MLRFAAVLVLGAAALSGRAQAATVVVKITDVASAKGQLMVSLCDRSSFGRSRCPLSTRVPARRGTVMVRFEKVPEGQWAAAVYHDENGNGALDRNGLGIPTEGGGFSRDARGKYGWPAFADAAVKISGETAVPVSLNY